MISGSSYWGVDLTWDARAKFEGKPVNGKVRVKTVTELKLLDSFEYEDENGNLIFNTDEGYFSNDMRDFCNMKLHLSREYFTYYTILGLEYKFVADWLEIVKK